MRKYLQEEGCYQPLLRANRRRKKTRLVSAFRTTDAINVKPPTDSSVNQSCRPAPTHAGRFLFLPSSVVTILPRVCIQPLR